MRQFFAFKPIYKAAVAAGLLCSTISAQAEDFGIEEIVVTAQKREQSLQDVGITVTAFSAEQLKEMNLSQPIELSAQTPGVEIKNTFGSSNPAITIRGIGLNDYHTNNNPSAAAHVDEVYLGSSAYLSFQMFDLERVEVLKGPQGTLYGRNSTAGTVNFISRKPSQEFEAYVDVGYGNYNTFELDSAVGGALTDQLSGRLAVMTQQSDGYITNVGTAGFEGYSMNPGKIQPLEAVGEDKKAAKVDAHAWRGSLLWSPNNQLDVMFSLHGSKEDSGGEVYAVNGPEWNHIDPATMFEDTDGDVFKRYDNTEPSIESDALGGYVRVDYKMDVATLTSLSAYETIDRHIVDGEGHPVSIGATDWAEDDWQFTQELRLNSNSDGDFHWMLGAFYSEDEIDFFKSWLSPNQDEGDYPTSYKQTNESWALFANTEWQMTEKLKLISGLRYTEEDKEYQGGTYFLDAYDTGDSFPFVDVTKMHHYNDDDLSGKIGLDWTPNNDLLLYASVSKGFKSGGFDGSTVTKESDLTPIGSETVWAYEVGFKSTLLNHTLQLNGSYFFYDYQDMQAEVRGEALPGVVGTFRLNAGDVEMRGAELDLWWRPLAGLDIKAGLSYLDSEIVKWAQADPELHEGDELPNAPHLTLNGLVRYEWKLTNGMTMAAITDFNFKDNVYHDVENAHEAGDYTLWNARLSLSSADDAWSVALWGKNLADREYLISSVGSYLGTEGTSFEWYGAPRTYGVSLSYRWQ